VQLRNDTRLHLLPADRELEVYTSKNLPNRHTDTAMKYRVLRFDKRVHRVTMTERPNLTDTETQRDIADVVSKVECPDTCGPQLDALVEVIGHNRLSGHNLGDGPGIIAGK
jgi:hypothetical protein